MLCLDKLIGHNIYIICFISVQPFYFDVIYSFFEYNLVMTWIDSFVSILDISDRCEKNGILLTNF